MLLPYGVCKAVRRTAPHGHQSSRVNELGKFCSSVVKFVHACCAAHCSRRSQLKPRRSLA
eukprot:4803010-Amphidinium_carterae.2